ncbi:MAG: efflux RND transporter permease subunit [Gemmatimonadota bacterium]
MLIRIGIRRPVAVTMTYLAVALLGVAAWQNIPIELLPNTELPRLTIEAQWPGSSPETVEAFLTSPIEATIQQLRGVENVISTSFEGRTQVRVDLARSTDMDFARLDLSERLATLREDLPPGITNLSIRPYIPEEFQTQYNRPFLRYTYTGPYTLEALRAHLDAVVVPELSRIDGVSEVIPMGGRERLLEIELDEDRITALGFTPSMIGQRIAELDLVREAGTVRRGDREWTVTVANRPVSVDEVRDALLPIPGGAFVRLGDVGHVRDGFEELRSLYRIDGREAISFIVMREAGSNTVRVADAVKARMAELERLNPGGVRVLLDDDQSEDIRRELTDLRSRAGVSAIVIFLVLLLFLRSFRSAGIIFATIVFSVLISLNLIYFGGLTLNLLTLMGLAMGFGLIVDNSIVVLESVYRKWQAGETPADAAEHGTKQVVLPILAATATTLIVFVPFVYLQGELRIFYVPLAIVVGLTLLASLFVAFTFIPSLGSRVLDVGGRGGGGLGMAAAGAESASPHKRPLYIRFYSALVGFTIRMPWIAVAVTVLVFGGSWHLFDTYVTRGVVWGGGWGQQTYITVNIGLPRGSDLDRTDELARFFEEKLLELPEVERFVTSASATQAQIRVTFPDSLELTQVPVLIKDQMVAYSLGFTGATIRVYGFGPSFYGGGGGAPNFSMTILGYNYERVRDIAEDVGGRLSSISRIRDIDTNASGNFFQRDRATEFAVRIDRDALSRYDMSVLELVREMQSAVAGRGQQRSVKIGGDDVRYEVKLEGFLDLDVRALEETVVTAPNGTALRLGNVITVTPRDVLSQIHRENQQYQRRVAYEFRGPQRLGEIFHNEAIAATYLPPGYSIEARRQFSWSREERQQIYMVLLISILLVYMVTAALFESLRQPLCVLLTVPMALIGVFLIFFYTNASFTREAYIGVIMMGGIVVNNAILLVDHINRMRRDFRLPLEAAILRGTLERVRPILMTTATTVLGLLPLVLFSAAADSTIWNALAYALIGGLLSSTLFVLTTTPALYALFEGRQVGAVETVDADAPGSGGSPEEPATSTPDPSAEPPPFPA